MGGEGERGGGEGEMGKKGRYRPTRERARERERERERGGIYIGPRVRAG